MLLENDYSLTEFFLPLILDVVVLTYTGGNLHACESVIGKRHLKVSVRFC